MRKYIYAAILAVAVTASGGAFAMATEAAVKQDQGQFADTSTPVPKDTTRVETTPGTTTTVVVKGGDLAAKILDWFWVAFGGSIGLLASAVLYKIFGYFGVQTTQMQRDQLQAIIVNGLNAGAAKAQTTLRSSDKLDFSSKNVIVNEAIQYTQDHAAETIKALGLDPKSGDAVQVIKARIETALNDPAIPTPAAITPDTGIKRA